MCTNNVNDPAGTGLQYYFIALLIGALTGLVGTVFHLLVGYLEVTVPKVPALLGVSGWAAHVLLALLSASMLCGAVALVRHFAPEAAGSGIQEVEGAMEGKRNVRWQRILPVKFFGGLLALGSGLIGGREGPTIHMGASIAQAISQRAVMAVRDARALLGAGSAAGLTTAFNAPIASVLFVIEEARDSFPYTLRNYYAVMFACAMSAMVTVLIVGLDPFLVIQAIAPPLEFYPVLLILGMLLGVIGVVFNRLVLVLLDYAQHISVRVSPYLWPLLLGCCLGPLLLALPDTTGGGEALIERLLQHPLSLALLGFLALARLIMTVVSYASGSPSGIFAPILALATVLSLFIGKLLALFIHLPPDGLVVLAVAGMAGLFASTIRAPMVGVVLIVELTGTYSLALPSLLCAAGASMVAAALGGQPIYTLLLERTLRLAGQAPANNDAATL